MRDTYVQEFVTMICDIANSSLPGFHNKNRVSTATERSNMQLSRFRFHFKRKKVLLSKKITSQEQCEFARTQWGNPLTISSEIALQVVRTSFRFDLRECMGSSFPPGLINLQFVQALSLSILKLMELNLIT